MGTSLPFLTSYDPPGTSEGALDPLGLYQIADQLAVQLVPAVRERMHQVTTRPKHNRIRIMNKTLTLEIDEQLLDRAHRRAVNENKSVPAWVATGSFLCPTPFPRR